MATRTTPETGPASDDFPSRRPLLYHWSDSEPAAPNTKAALDALGAERVILMPKHYFAPGGGGAIGTVNPVEFLHRIRHGLPGGGQPPLQEDFTGRVTIDPEDQWRDALSRKPQMFSDAQARAAQYDMFQVLDTCRDALPLADIGWFQFYDLTPAATFDRRRRMLIDLFDELAVLGPRRHEPGAYVVHRNDMAGDAAIVNGRIARANAFGGPIYLWLKITAPGGVLSPAEWESWLSRWTGPEISGWCLFDANHIPSDYVRAAGRILR
jgi:hypothetical protein